MKTSTLIISASLLAITIGIFSACNQADTRPTLKLFSSKTETIVWTNSFRQLGSMTNINNADTNKLTTNVTVVVEPLLSTNKRTTSIIGYKTDEGKDKVILNITVNE